MNIRAGFTPGFVYLADEKGRLFSRPVCVREL
jgi:hypothetical protein